MTNQEEHTIVAQWISTSQDSVFISEDMLYYGKIDSSEYHPKLLTEMASIPLSYLRVLEINSKKKTTTLEYSSTILIRWEKLDSLNEFKKFMIRRFPDSFTLFREDTLKFKTRGTIVALVIIPIIYLIALLTPTDKTYSSGSKRFGEAIIALFQALASMGVLSLTLLFGSLFLIATLKLFYARNKSSYITIIQLR
jgi:hypothetical protein